MCVFGGDLTSQSLFENMKKLMPKAKVGGDFSSGVCFSKSKLAKVLCVQGLLRDVASVGWKTNYLWFCHLANKLVVGRT